MNGRNGSKRQRPFGFEQKADARAEQLVDDAAELARRWVAGDRAHVVNALVFQEAGARAAALVAATVDALAHHSPRLARELAVTLVRRWSDS